MTVRECAIAAAVAVLALGTMLLPRDALADGSAGRGPRAGPGGSSSAGRGDAGSGPGAPQRSGAYGSAGSYGRYSGGWYGNGSWSPDTVPGSVLDAFSVPPLWCGCYSCSPYPRPGDYPASVVVATPDEYPLLPVNTEPWIVNTPAAETPSSPLPSALPATALPATPLMLWYWCAEPAGYYPYVQRCGQTWQPVLPNNVPPEMRTLD